MSAITPRQHYEGIVNQVIAGKNLPDRVMTPELMGEVISRVNSLLAGKVVLNPAKVIRAASEENMHMGGVAAGTPEMLVSTIVWFAHIAVSAPPKKKES